MEPPSTSPPRPPFPWRRVAKFLAVMAVLVACLVLTSGVLFLKALDD